VPGIEAGRLAFGLCPMATEVMLRPVRAGQATFTEGSAHRSGLAGAYNVYSWADAGAPDDDDAALVLRPVFWLSFTLDDYLSRQAGGERPVIVTSASSKAAIGLAYLLGRRGGAGHRDHLHAAPPVRRRARPLRPGGLLRPRRGPGRDGRRSR
jgi:hypothetical protein